MSEVSTHAGGNGRGKMFKVLCPIERKDGNGTFWMRVGSAFPNRDQSINLYLDAIPVGHNRLQIREMEEEDFARKRRDDAPAPPAPGGNSDLPF